MITCMDAMHDMIWIQCLKVQGLMLEYEKGNELTLTPRFSSLMWSLSSEAGPSSSWRAIDLIDEKVQVHTQGTLTDSTHTRESSLKIR